MADHPAIGTSRSYQYYISIDFGTHGSGFAYMAKGDGDNVRTYEYWPGQRGNPAAKTRTALLYRLSDMARPVAWGWEALKVYADLPVEVRSQFILLESFKRYLMPTDFTGLEKLPPGLTVKKIVADFLSLMAQLVSRVLAEQYGARYAWSSKE